MLEVQERALVLFSFLLFLVLLHRAVALITYIVP